MNNYELISMKYQSIILKTLLIIMVCISCVGCGGDSEHETEALIEDEYGYTGSWLGQISDNEFIILNIMRADEKDNKIYALMYYDYGLVSYSDKEINDSTTQWKLHWINDFNIYEAKGNEEKMVFLSKDNPFEIKVDGKNMTLNINDSKDSFKLKRISDYEDMKDEVKTLKKNMVANLQTQINKQYPNLKLVVTDETKDLKKIIKP